MQKADSDKVIFDGFVGEELRQARAGVGVEYFSHGLPGLRDRRGEIAVGVSFPGPIVTNQLNKG